MMKDDQGNPIPEKAIYTSRKDVLIDGWAEIFPDVKIITDPEEWEARLAAYEKG